MRLLWAGAGGPHQELLTVGQGDVDGPLRPLQSQQALSEALSDRPALLPVGGRVGLVTLLPSQPGALHYQERPEGGPTKQLEVFDGSKLLDILSTLMEAPRKVSMTSE